MVTFDGWDARICGDALALPPGSVSGDYLMHFRTRGSKNGVRRYQQTDGTWTPLGLRMRKEREGWGDSRAERKAEKRVMKAERKAAKTQKRIERKEAAKEKTANKKASRTKLSNLSDAELKKKIERIKMEMEYKELTKSPIIKTGERVVSSIMDAKAKREAKEAERAKQELERERIRSEVIKARESTKRAKADAEKAASDAKAAQSEWGSKAKLVEQQTALKTAKTNYRGTTIRGGIARKFNSMLNGGNKQRDEARGKIAAQKLQNKYNADQKRKNDNEAERLKREQDKEDKRRFKEQRKAYEEQWKSDAATSRYYRQLEEERRRKQKAFSNWG